MNYAEKSRIGQEEFIKNDKQSDIHLPWYAKSSEDVIQSLETDCGQHSESLHNLIHL